jgi:hypothetical protein
LCLKIAQLINVITDANDAIKSQFTEDAINLLKATMANGKNPNLLRVLCASILFNLSPTEHVPALLKMTLPIINMCLDFEPQTTIIQTIQPHLKGLVSHKTDFVFAIGQKVRKSPGHQFYEDFLLGEPFAIRYI